MFGTVLAFLLGTSLSVTLPSIKNCDFSENEVNSIFINSYENITSAQWHNNTNKIDDESINFFDAYSINCEEALKSTDVYVQEEYLEFDEYVPSNILNESPNNNVISILSNQESEFIHNKGYIKFITKAYSYGFYDGGIVYHVEVTTEQQKSFFINNSDNLIIRHGNNSTTLNLENYKTSGTRFTPCTIYWTYDPSNPTIADETQILTPNYSCSTGGVYYTFKAGGSSTYGDYSSVVYGNTIVNADYYLVATDTTEVQPVYVHNYSWFVDSVSVSFGPIGVSVNASSSDIMECQTMTLKGYDDRIETNILTIDPSDYGFQAQYYFYKKSVNHTIGNWNFTSDRLRCGYIEEEYINLSPNRNNAGVAYLEYSFDTMVYEVDTHLSFWSSSENLSSSAGDTAFVQYLDSNGNWITCLDLLNCNLSTDRSKQDYFEIDILEGTKGIRFIATKSTPMTNRNKGRICIGETKFVNYKLV